MELIDYLYYRIYRFAEIISFGLRYPFYRAAAVAAVLIFVNGCSLISMLEISKIRQENFFYYLLIFIILFWVLIRFFSNKNMYRRTFGKFRNELWYLDLFGNVLVFLLLIVSFIGYVKIRVHSP